MPDLKYSDSITCLNCHWEGKVDELISRPTAPSEEDAIDFMECPKCRESLAIRGWNDFVAIPAKIRIKKSNN